ncbi:MAG: NAD(P)H-quinone oxidoreductase [Labilithrix sp.]|nr:NAD(P)H-quinone oxidoreductase [Labilithrix sp.]MCW5815497.1 NAD(P)H-quinone oxidoreductase [Labilithrix sp.]
MRAVVIDNGSLHLREVPTPGPGPGQARVRVRAAGVNRADLMQLRGMYPAPPDAPPDIPGLEIAGEVDAVGAGVREVAVGERVFTIVGGGAYAEHVVVPARTLAPIPEGLDFTHAAAIPEAFLTAYDAMVLQAGLSAGDDVLVHAVGSGVGTAAVQIARAIGATAIGTARTQDKLDRAAALGMKHGILAADAKFADEVKRHTSGRGADVVLELVGGAYLPESLAACAERGRVVLVGLMGGATAELSLGPMLHRRLTVIGTVMRARPLEQKIALGQVLRRNITPLVAAGHLVPIVDRVLPLEQATAALTAMASNTTFGKIILTP